MELDCRLKGAEKLLVQKVRQIHHSPANLGSVELSSDARIRGQGCIQQPVVQVRDLSEHGQDGVVVGPRQTPGERGGERVASLVAGEVTPRLTLTWSHEARASCPDSEICRAPAMSARLRDPSPSSRRSPSSPAVASQVARWTVLSRHGQPGAVRSRRGRGGWTGAWRTSAAQL
jgi:hypothetical protein